MAVEPENSRLREDFLRQPKFWAGVEDYFSAYWEAREVRASLMRSGVDIRLVQELALWSFQPLGKSEAEQKRKRGQHQKKLCQEFLKGCDRGIKYCEPYLGLGDDHPDNRAIRYVAEDIIRRIVVLQEEFQQIRLRDKQNRTFDAKRLGTSWNSEFCHLLKAHLAFITGWDDRKVLTAMVHLVRAAQQQADPKLFPDNRRLLQKAIRHFETNPHNALIMQRLEKLAANPAQLSRIFRPITSGRR